MAGEFEKEFRQIRADTRRKWLSAMVGTLIFVSSIGLGLVVGLGAWVTGIPGLLLGHLAYRKIRGRTYSAAERREDFALAWKGAAVALIIGYLLALLMY